MSKQNGREVPGLSLVSRGATRIDKRRSARGVPCNLDRAERAREALERFAKRAGLLSVRNRENVSTIVSDFLSDLLHLCRIGTVDFDRCLSLARIQHDAERKGVEA